MNPTIDILLATYNGERFLAEQIQSILDQTYAQWRLLIRDDGSTDTTTTLIRTYAEKYPEKIVLIEDVERNLGACGNFGMLLRNTNADYIMFCDQDDVWLPKKIEMTFAKMQEMERLHGRTLPLLVYTDMKVVDSKLNIIADSYWDRQALNPKSGKRLNRLLVNNVIIGCTMLFNKKLRDLSLPLPAAALMHDWWLGLVAVAFGRCDYLRIPTLLYRQHEKNVVGARWSFSLQSIFAQITEIKKHKEFIVKAQAQAKAFIACYQHLLDWPQLEKILVYSKLSEQGFLRKRYLIIRYHFWWSGCLRSIAMLVII